MSGLLSGVLPAIYSASNKLQRNVNGLLDNPKNYLAGLLMDANTRAGGLLDATNAATQESSAAVRSGGGLFQGPANNKLAEMLANSYGPAGLTVWHGSPHKFARFDSSKIGTGEGAQAYGHGMYFAESPGVAKNYAEQLSTAPGPAGDVAKYWRSNGGESAFRAFAKDAGLPAQEVEQIAGVIRNSGSLYKVDLPDNAIARMLDWDKPLSGQAPEVQAGLKRYMGPEWDKTWDSFQGVNAYDVLAGGRHGNPAGNIAAAEKLRQQGIPGIRYLDGGSRGTGAGTSNFVVFPGEEGLLQILERNGIPMR